MTAAATTPPGMDANVHVALRGLSKNYGGVAAVREVDLDIIHGSVHAIVGENGAGKSTVGKMIAGVIKRSDGEILVDGEAVHFDSPRQALAHRIAMIDQEFQLVPTRSVMDNVFLALESSHGGVLDVGTQQKRFAELIERTGFDVKRDARVGSLSVAAQQKVEILRAIARDATLIVMDEPTAPLTHVEAEQLYAIIRMLRDEGRTIVFVSHFLSEVLEIADTVTVMRDGRHVKTSAAADETVPSLVQSMLGRTIESAFPERTFCPPDAKPLLEVRNLTAPGRFEDVSFAIRPGEIVGMAGLVGSGRTEVARAIFGADGGVTGEVLYDGEPVQWRSPREAIAAGVGMLPESRKEDGLAMLRSISENIVISDLDEVSTAGLLKPGREKRVVDKLMVDFDIRASSSSAPVASLSGGNQQKVLFARCLMPGPRVMLIDEPTRGVDVGAKRAIYDLLVNLASSGIALLVVSSELEEVLGLSHRLLVMRRGRLVADLSIEQATRERVLHEAFDAA